MRYVFTIAVMFVVFTPVASMAATLGGWEHFQAEQLGRHNGSCEAGQSKRDFILRDYGGNDVNPQGLRMKAQVVARDNSTESWQVVRETGWVFGSNLSPAVCYNPDIESPRVVVETDSAANYLPFNGAAWWGQSKESRQLEKGRYQRGSVHLKAKSPAPTLELLDPINVFTRINTPSLMVKTNDVALLYGAKGMTRTFFGFWQNNVRTARFAMYHGGTTGVRSYQPGRLGDGLYSWTTVQQLNGSSDVKSILDSFDTSCGSGLERVDVGLYEVGGVTPINPRGITADVVVKNKSNESVVTKVSFAPNTTISPTVCYSSEKHAIGLVLTVGIDAQYFNGGVETVKQNLQVVQGANGKKYFRISAELPPRTQPVVGTIQPQFTTIESTNTLKDRYTQKWKWIPGTGISEMKQFYVDTTAPTVAAVVTSSTSTTAAEALVKVTARDIGSGLRELQMVFTPVKGVGSVATVTLPFTVGSGLVGGPKDAQQATWRIALRPGTTYRYVATAIDVAGNQVSTAAQTFTAVSLTPDLSFANFYIKNTCTPEAMNFVADAVCNQTTLALALRNNSNGVINRNTNIPYRIEYRFPGNDSGVWTEIHRGVYTEGIEAQTQTPLLTVTTNREMRGTGQVRALVNMTPQTNTSIGEMEFGNNTSPNRTIVFAAVPPTLSLTTDRQTIRSGQSVTLSWRIESPQGVACELRGNGAPITIRHEGGETVNSLRTNPITSTQKFTLSCVGDMGGDPTEVSVTVEVVPYIDEV